VSTVAESNKRMTRGQGAQREGHRYQDVYGWFRALELLRASRKVWRVSIEDPTAGFFDDVTVRPEEGTDQDREFAQVKFHVDQAGSYSTEALTTAKSRNGRSLLQKAWESWLILREEGASVRLLLVSTYSWESKDPVAKHIRGYRLTLAFVSGDVTGRAAAARNSWWEHLGRPDQEAFHSFLASLRLRLGYDATNELIERTAERMEAIGLKHEEEDVLAGAEQVWQWIRAGKDTISREDMLDAVESRNLAAPGPTPEPAVSLYIHTILKEPAEADADWELDWRSQFEGDEWLRGHRVIEPGAWNERMLPELYQTREQIAATTGCRLLFARGKARLSAWFALGAVFSRVAGWTIEVDQGGQRWRNDAEPAADFEIEQDVEDRGGPKGTLAIAISITGDLTASVQSYLAHAGEPAERLLLVRPASGLGVTSMRSAGDVTALAQLVRDAARTALGVRAGRVLLFYFGPLSGAAFIGAQLNAIAPEIQIFEDQVSGYEPSFTLRLG